MRWTRLVMDVTVGLFVLSASISPAAAQSRDNRDQDAKGRRAVHQERDRITGATFSSMPDGQGNARLTITLDDFQLEKILAPTGDATIRLIQDKDLVTVAISHDGYVVQRGRRTARFDPQTGQVGDLDAVRSVLLGSPAVRVFRRLSASLEDRDDGDTGPLMLGALVDGATVDMLDGDAAAPGRIGKRITRKQRAAMRPAKMLPGDYMFEDCVLKYEMSLTQAWDLYWQCQETAWNNRWYIWFFSENLCELEFLLRSQQYIYQFMTCFAYPF